jgi:hypothetical protein
MTFGNTVPDTASRGKEIKYVLVELIMVEDERTKSLTTKEKDTPHLGLLRGIYNGDDGEFFLSIVNGKEEIKNFNMSLYNVLMFEIFDGLEREIFFCRADKEDQDEILEIIKSTLTALKRAERITANENIVDVNKFSDLPKAIDQNDSTKNTSNVGVQNVYGQQNTGGVYSRSGAGYYEDTPHTTTYTKKKEPATFKRTTDIPPAKVLEKMKEMVLKITNGTFKAKKLEFPGEVEKKDSEKDGKENDSTTTHDEEDFYGWGYGNGLPGC